MSIFWIIGWLIYGLIVGSIARWIHPGDDPEGFLPTMGIGVAGSYIGGFINYILGWGDSVFSTSGFVMGIAGGVLACIAYRWYKANSSQINDKIEDLKDDIESKF